MQEMIDSITASSLKYNSFVFSLNEILNMYSALFFSFGFTRKKTVFCFFLLQHQGQFQSHAGAASAPRTAPRSSAPELLLQPVSSTAPLKGERFRRARTTRLHLSCSAGGRWGCIAAGAHNKMKKCPSFLR